MVVAVRRRNEAEGLATIRRAEQPGVQRIDRVSRLGVGVDLGEIPRTLLDAPIVADASPVRAAVVRSVQPRLFRFDHREHAARVGRRHRNIDPPKDAFGQAMSGQPYPSDSAIARPVQAAAGAAARKIPWLAAHFPERGIDNRRVGGVEGHVDRAGVVVLVENLLPRLAAIDGAEDAALGIGAKGVPDCSDQHDIRVVGVDD